MKDHFQELHSAADENHAAFSLTETPKPRCCPVCGKEVEIAYGRHTGKFFWSHVGLTSCPETNGRVKFFDTRQEAEQAQEIWR